MMSKILHVQVVDPICYSTNLSKFSLNKLVDKTMQWISEIGSVLKKHVASKHMLFEFSSTYFLSNFALKLPLYGCRLDDTIFRSLRNDKLCITAIVVKMTTRFFYGFPVIGISALFNF